jgi:O-antigen/teichoic acid export membrane protein
MTWLSYSTKALSLFGVLPLVLKQFSSEEVALWYLFSAIISLQSLADFGFRQTFSRAISYAWGGADDLIVTNQNKSELPISGMKYNIGLMLKIVSTMRYIYIWLSLGLLFLMSTGGSWMLVRPINQVVSLNEAWIAWGVIVLTSIIGFYAKIYLNFLEGLFKIALVRRVEAFTSSGAIITSILVLYICPSLLNLVIANQIWALIAVFRDWILCRGLEDNLFKNAFKKIELDKDIFRKIWGQAWRSGVSGLVATGLTNFPGIVYAQFASSSVVASYLLAFRMINQIKDVSTAPFYSKIPLLSILRVRKESEKLKEIIKRSMFLSHLVFVAGFIFVGVFFKVFISKIGAEVQFVDSKMWILMGLAFFAHRFGAMHIQVYMSTNHIISHIADGISGLIYALTTILLYRQIGILAVPVGMLAGYLFFYTWYAARFSYASLNTNFWEFEKKASLFPFILMLGYSIFAFIPF